LAKQLQNQEETNAYRLSSLASALGVLAARMEPKDAVSLVSPCAQVLVGALKNGPKDVAQQSSLATGLAALAARMDAKYAASVAERFAAEIENPEETSFVHLSSLASALTVLAARMDRQDAANIAQPLASALSNPAETNADRLASLGSALGGLSRIMPSARHTHRLALSNVLLMANHAPYAADEAIRLSAALGAQDVAEVLKWPFCVGETEKMVLAELEKKTGRQFGGNLWKFVELAPSLGVKDLDAPAKRPRVEDALAELRTIAGGNAAPGPSGGR
jgi:hypothetical protein